MEDQRQEAAERLLQLLRGGEPSGPQQCDDERLDDDNNININNTALGHRRPDFALLETAPSFLAHRSQHPSMMRWRTPSHVLSPPLPPIRRHRRFELPLVQGQFDDAPEPPKLPPVGGSARGRQQQQQHPTDVLPLSGSASNTTAVLGPIGKPSCGAWRANPASVRRAVGAFRPVSRFPGCSSLRRPSASLFASVGTMMSRATSSSNRNHIIRLAAPTQSHIALQEPALPLSVATTTASAAAASRWVPIAPWPGTNPTSATATKSAKGHASAIDQNDHSSTTKHAPVGAARHQDNLCSKRPGAAGRATVPSHRPSKRARVAAAAAALSSSRPPPLPDPALASLITSHPSPLLLPGGPGLPIPLSESSQTTLADRSPIAPTALTERDILLGRGGQINRHAGNRTFRQVCDQYRLAYCTAKKGDKRRLAHQLALYFTLACGSRFVTKKSSLSSSKANNHDDDDDDDDCWYEVSLEKAALKCGQTLREGTAEMVRQTLQNQQQLEQGSCNKKNNAMLSAPAKVTDSSSQATVSGETNEKAKCSVGNGKERMTVTPSEEAAGGASSSSRSLEQGA